MSYLDVTFRGRVLEVEWRCVEDDPTTGAFEIEWSFVDRTDWGSEPTDAEDDEIIELIADRYSEDCSAGDEDY